MRIEQLAIIFVIIILPISMVLNMYANNNSDVIKTQAEYNDILLTATTDAVNAYQMNTLRNGYSTINDSKIRDISASVNSFFNSLASGIGSSGYRKEDLEPYIPAILFTLYDGYYLYGDYQNIVSIKNGKQEYSTKNLNDLDSSSLQTGVKPFIYYTCEYKGSGNFDIVINYTLDNYITVMGKDYDGTIINRSGYLIDSSTVREQDGKLFAHDVEIEPEVLGEYLVAIDTIPKADGSSVTQYTSRKPEYFQYVNYNNQKYYIDTKYGSSNIDDDNPGRENTTYVGVNIFRLNNNLRVYLTETEANGLAQFLGLDNYTQITVDNFKDYSAQKYYKQAKEFSDFFVNLFSGQTNLTIVTDSYNEQLNYTAYDVESGEEVPVHSRADYNLVDVFNISSTNDPETVSSLFNEHRMDVIISSIESNLLSIIANFNVHYNSGFEFTLPVLSEEDWYTITNNVTVVSFMQGIPIGNYKYYNNYSIVANTLNKEFVSRESIILMEKESGVRTEDTNKLYHNPRCKKLNENNLNNLQGYNIVDYQQQLTSYDEVDPTSYKSTTLTYYYYPHSGSGAYECMIGKEDVLYSTDNLIKGTAFTSPNDAYDVTNPSNTPGSNVRKAYITALAREKYNLYKVSDYFNIY